MSVEESMKKLEELGAWINALSQEDRSNFIQLLALPNAEKVIAKCPDPKYREMAILALALRKAGLA